MENYSLILGTFDGVHTAHRELISQGKSLADKAVACTFPLPPSCCFDKTVRALSTKDEKIALLEKYGVDKVFMRDFREISSLSAENYIKMLCEQFNPKFIVAGYNHKFGNGATGNFQTLSALSKIYGFKAQMVLPVKNNNEIISSTLIRSLLLKGNIERANELLGRSYSFGGIVEHGKRIGTEIGFPTANVAVAAEKLVPNGVFASVVSLGERKMKAVTNVGFNPTVASDNKRTVETHILGFSEDIYGKHLTIELVKRLRDEKKFASLDELKQQLSNDVFLTDAII